MKANRTSKFIITITATILLICCTITTSICFYIVKSNTESRIYSDVLNIPHNKVGLLLGTAPITKSGVRNLYFDYRIDAAIDLFKAGKIDYILVSGDNHCTDYDEPSCMQDSLIIRGVPKNRIILDYAGFRTLDSVIRAKKYLDKIV